jgi:hypothetical protein
LPLRDVASLTNNLPQGLLGSCKQISFFKGSVNMTFLNSVFNDSPEKILCCYINNSYKIQIIRTFPNSGWERVVFPGQRLLFEALPSDKLQIQICKVFSILIPCYRLRVNENSSLTQSPSLTHIN